MSRVTEKDLEGVVRLLNVTMGYKGISYSEKQRKYIGKGFLIQTAYGGVQLQFANYAKSRGVRSVNKGYIGKRELYEYIYSMAEGALWYSQRTGY